DPVVRHGDGRLRSRRPGIAITHPTEVLCRNAFMTNILLARVSSHARGKVDTVKVVSLNRCRPCTVIKLKRPPAVEINSFSSYPKNTHLRTNIYFGAERILGYSTDISWTSSSRNMGKCPRKHMHLLRSL